MSIFSKIAKAFRQMVSWFRPDDGGSFVHRLMYDGVPRPPGPRPVPPPPPIPQPPPPPVGRGAVAPPTPEQPSVSHGQRAIEGARHHRGDPRPAMIGVSQALGQLHAVHDGVDQPVPVMTESRNRRRRRAEAAYERARRKHDKFVEPEGPVPIPISMRPDSPAPGRKSDKYRSLTSSMTRTTRSSLTNGWRGLATRCCSRAPSSTGSSTSATQSSTSLIAIGCTSPE